MSKWKISSIVLALILSVLLVYGTVSGNMSFNERSDALAMQVTEEDWATWWADLNANFDFTIPIAIDYTLVEGTSNFAEAKPTIDELARLGMATYIIEGLARFEQTQNNILTSRIYEGKEGYLDDYPEFDPNDFPQPGESINGTSLFEMIEPYVGYDVYGITIADFWYYVVTTLHGKVRDATDKTNNILEHMIVIEPKF